MTVVVNNYYYYFLVKFVVNNYECLFISFKYHVIWVAESSHFIKFLVDDTDHSTNRQRHSVFLTFSIAIIIIFFSISNVLLL